MVLYSIGKFIFTFYFRLCNRVSVQGKDNIPETGGLIICPNHIHWLDPMLVAVCIKREINYMSKAELFKNKLLAAILKGLNAFPVKRGTPDISAIKTSFKLIKDGKVLGIFPEGTRSKDGKLKTAEPGVALISIKTNAPIVPIRISGSYKLFGKLGIIIGKPLSFEGYNNKKAAMGEINELSQSIMLEIGKLK